MINKALPLSKMQIEEPETKYECASVLAEGDKKLPDSVYKQENGKFYVDMTYIKRIRKKEDHLEIALGPKIAWESLKKETKEAILNACQCEQVSETKAAAH